MSIRIENYRIGSEAALREVFYSAIREGCVEDYTAQQIAAWAPEDYDHQWWSSLMRRLRPFVAWEGSRIVGYADLQDDGYIDHFFVHGRHQGRGVGKALMRQILSAGADRGRLYSHVSRTAKPFFKRYGFRIVRCRDVEVQGVTMQNYLMERPQRQAL